ncbi:2-C-methyl-D-erythritol 2,4-cyclodiphosphate synthase [bacterium]|nr:2-C-methyl-D-erythritol 2,4-cyclodiphosphate synthase [bacterium]
MLRVGFGYDVHPVMPGKKLWLGGVAFPQAGFQLKGHSDADVVLHAACDALLGAAGLPDIGVLYPNTSARNRNRSSLEFLTDVGKKVAKEKYRILNLDCMLLAEAPKIAGQTGLMRTRMARALAVAQAQINVKATTHEGLGAIGRKEGLAAYAVVLLIQQDKIRIF